MRHFVRLGAGAALVAVLVAAVAAPVAAGGGSTAISTAVAGSFVVEGPSGTFASTCGDVGVELVPDPLPVPWLWYTAYEFPLTTLPAGSTVISANLALRDADGASPDPMQIYGYAGNGAVTAADVVASGTPVGFTPTGIGYENHDVTSLVSPAALAAGWSGFLLAVQTTDFSTVHHHFDCPDDAQFPVLTITYALPDAAMANPEGPSPLVVIGLGLLLLGAADAIRPGLGRRARSIRLGLVNSCGGPLT